jgi:hypothetical protein
MYGVFIAHKCRIFYAAVENFVYKIYLKNEEQTYKLRIQNFV